MKIFIQILTVLALVISSARADHDISAPYVAFETPIVVDGDLSDWEHCLWVDCDETYRGIASDITSASYCLAHDTGFVYVAVRITDTEHNFTDSFIAADAADCVEVFCDGRADYDTYGTFQLNAQHAYLGSDNQNDWAIMQINNYAWDCLDYNTLILDMAVSVNGDDIVYEVMLEVYEQVREDPLWNGYSLPIENGTEIGFDLLVNSKMDDGSFASLCNNTASDKETQCSNFQKWIMGKSAQAMANGYRPTIDFDHDGDVDIFEFLILKANYGTKTGATWNMGDLDGDEDVDIFDFLILKAYFIGFPDLPIEFEDKDGDGDIDFYDFDSRLFHTPVIWYD